MATLKEICSGLPVDPLPPPPPQERDTSVPHAPVRKTNLTFEEEKLALKNALRYFPIEYHPELAPEFAYELKTYGHIYMYRFRPAIPMKAYPIHEYPTNTKQAAAIMHMIMNNLDPEVAQFPHELVTYGGNGQVLSNWAQFWILMYYLAEMNEDQMLVMNSGHPQGLYPAFPDSPRLVISNGLVIPNYSSRSDYERMFALGVSMYGQMTAGSYSYIGPQGIVHGTTITIMNVARRRTGTSVMSGKVFVTSGLGGMSGAQPKAAVICGCIGVVAEVFKDALEKRHKQGWVTTVCTSLEDCIARIREYKKKGEAVSIGFHGNVVTLWEGLAEEYEKTGELLVDFGSDQTSLHCPFNGGYYPVQLTFEEAQKVMVEKPDRFKTMVQESLRRQIAAINKLSAQGMYFWDYGNAFLLEAGRAGADVFKEFSEGKYKYPTYIQDIMGDIFSLGFGPFRWVCTSGNPVDLEKTDEIAKTVLLNAIGEGVPENIQEQYEDNIKWITEAAKHKMVVGSQARILYSDLKGRRAIALAFNDAVKTGKIEAPVVITRDHHDVSGTDSPFRETSNVYDGSCFCADMAIQNVIGDSFRGATWVSIHNGGGVGWGEVINGGFGIVLDGTPEADEHAASMLMWDVLNGISRRSWTGNSNAEATIKLAMKDIHNLEVTVPYHVKDHSVIESALEKWHNG
ncbi:uncharacterized protein TRIADDRAFT_36098 [Trichoplax adhaerens]|uniref:Urocanate hydratase n=1 Tax=Trichoplax adhaerens TaxID=10228 RepID=B3S0X0_TRIAD|nr:hypothetical protein TRIADDRAFT_36098 [Trichoplax adhaerens]EDV23720.1 hypothetical protein TRIADDRAFT_36098 [Trichoplax adhaerens]|eukprot:XP_002113246.1 hypothetical protein TRIADDRAFT_36098 [Trichoplax adhaerens]